MTYEKLSATEVISRLEFWKEHPHAGLPSYIEQAIEVMKRQQTENKRLKRIENEAQKIVDAFQKIGRFQDQRLGHGLKEACQNWGEASETAGMIDFADLIKVLKGE